MPSPPRRRALLGAGLLCSVSLLALTPMLAEREAATSQPDPQPPQPAADDVASLLSSPVGGVGIGATQAPVHHEAYLSDRVMIRPGAGEDARAIAMDHGGSLVRSPGRSGWVALSIPTGTNVGRAVEALRADPRVAQAGPVGLVRGAASDPVDIQYKTLHSMQVTGGSASSRVTVAVIDSGVAYEDYTDDGVTYVQAETLSSTTFRHPFDFVNNDTHANDDHMHGTHIASIIASKPQFSGDMRGIAPGVAIMPIKVLDATNTGNELDLIDGIWHAIDNGADIINLSLAFDESYVPSAALQQALRAAHDEHIVTIAAAGNDAANRVAWPAASPYVIAVAAACPDKAVAPYTNASAAVHVTGIGGCMHVDKNSDGYPDGVIGETIVEGDPSQTQYVLWAGSSQAAATVSGQAARQLSREDGHWSTVGAVLQRNSTLVGNGGRDKGTGAGIPQRAEGDDLETAPTPGSYLVAVLPYLHRGDATKAKPAALVHVLDSSGNPASSGEVWLTVTGSTQETTKCTVSEGVCHYKHSADVALLDASGAPAALGWAIQVDAFVVNDVNQLVEPAMFATDGLEVLVAAMDAESDLDGIPLGIYWPDDAQPRSGVHTAEAYAFVDSGVGFASSPLGVLLTPGNFPSTAVSTVSVDLDGVGFSSSPLGLMNLTLIEFGGVGFSSSPLGGVGFSSSPLGLSNFKLAVFDGVGFSSSPLGLDAFDLYAPNGSTIYLSGVGFSSSPLGGVGFASSPLNLATGLSPTASLDGTELGHLVNSGGWTVGEGSFAVGTALIGASMVDMTPEAVGAGVGDGWEVCE